MRQGGHRVGVAGDAPGGPDPRRRHPTAPLRPAVSCAAVAATFPYLALKLNWVLGGTVGMADPRMFDNTWHRVANLVNLAMDSGGRARRRGVHPPSGSGSCHDG
jgi:hypothetical protein